MRRVQWESSLFIIIDSFLITWWPWKPVQLDENFEWLHFDNSGSQWIMKNVNAWACTIIQISRDIKMWSINAAIQLHWFPWSLRYEKRFYTTFLGFHYPFHFSTIVPTFVKRFSFVFWWQISLFFLTRCGWVLDRTTWMWCSAESDMQQHARVVFVSLSSWLLWWRRTEL